MGVTEQDFSQLSMPDTDPMFILADPDRAFELSNQIKGLV
jgi:pyruvate,water dikinase